MPSTSAGEIFGWWPQKARDEREAEHVLEEVLLLSISLSLKFRFCRRGAQCRDQSVLSHRFSARSQTASDAFAGHGRVRISVTILHRCVACLVCSPTRRDPVRSTENGFFGRTHARSAPSYGAAHASTDVMVITSKKRSARASSVCRRSLSHESALTVSIDSTASIFMSRSPCVCSFFDPANALTNWRYNTSRLPFQISFD